MQSKKVKTMDAHASEKKPTRKTAMTLIKCSCGAEILLVPNVKLMSEAIEKHVEKHKRKIKNQKEAEVEAERIRDYLITQVFDKASEA